MSQPTVNIEGIYSGYTGPGGKTILPHKATAKLDLQLVPGQTAAENMGWREVPGDVVIRIHPNAPGRFPSVRPGRNPSTPHETSARSS